jgi:hypothetical protein
MRPGGAASAYIGSEIRVSRALTSSRRDTGARKPEVGQPSWPLGNANGFCHCYGSPTLGNDEQGAALGEPLSGRPFVCRLVTDKYGYVFVCYFARLSASSLKHRMVTKVVKM